MEPNRYLRKPLASGRTADIYTWDEGRVLKLFYPWFSPRDVEHEEKISRLVHATGLRAPAVEGVIEVDGRLGLVYERVEGISLLDEIQRKPWTIGRYARRLAELHLEIHATNAPAGIPPLKEKLGRRIRAVSGIPEEVRGALLQALAALPDGHALCHGDFHPDNVLVTTEGLIAMDWIDASVGVPIADVARTSALVMGELDTPTLTSSFERVIFGWAHQIYRRRYAQLQPAADAWHDAWIPVVAAARMSEGIEELAPWLRRQAETILGSNGAADGRRG